MMVGAYYNDTDPYAAQWLRNLIAAGEIPPGDVDERSIVNVSPDDLKGYMQCHFFAGIGGWALALRLAGLPDDREIWSGSCPCQPLSGAGKQQGHLDQRHLWPAFYRLIAECRPATVAGEQVAGALGREWLAGIRIDLEAAGYAVGAADLCAAGVRAPHIRQRLYWVGHANGAGREARDIFGERTEARSEYSSQCGATDGVANAEHAERRPVGEWRGRDRQDGGRAQTYGIAGTCGEVRGVGNASSPRLEERPGVRRDYGPERAPAERTGGAFYPCLDGKSRRVEPGIFPLAHGIPRDMGRGRSREQRVAIRAARAYRTGTLRGYGNAIVPQVAAEFIKAAMEVI